MVIQDPETGDINLGTYRMGILDNKSVGVQILKGKKADRIMKKYAQQGKKMLPVPSSRRSSAHFCRRRHCCQSKERVRCRRVPARRSRRSSAEPTFRAPHPCGR